MGFWNALSALAPVAPAMADAQDIRAQRQKEAQELAQQAAAFPKEQALRDAQLTAQKLAAQGEQQRLRTGSQPLFKEGSQPEFNPLKGTYTQPAWNPDKGIYEDVAVPGVTPQETEKYRLESFKKNRAAAQEMMPNASPEQLDYLGYTLSGMKPPPASKFTPLPGAAGQPQLGPDGKTSVVRGRDENGNIVVKALDQDYKPAPVKPLSPAVRFTNLLAKQILASQKKGPPLTAQEAADLAASKSELTLNGISTATARAVENARYGVTNVTDETGEEVAQTRLNVANAASAGAPFAAGTVGAPTGLDKKNQMLAQSALTQIDSMERVLAADPNLTGPGNGQYTRFQTWLGSNSPDSQQFLAAATFLSEHGVGVFGGRNIHSITDLQNLMGSLKTNPAALKAALEQARTTMLPWTTAGGRLPGPRGAGAGATGATGAPKTAADYLKSVGVQ